MTGSVVYRKVLINYRVVLLLGALCMQNLALIQLDGGAGLKLFHVVFLLVCLVSINDFRIEKKFKSCFLFVSFINVLGVLLLTIYGFNSLFLNYMFMFFILYAVSIYLEEVDYESLVVSIRAVFLLALTYVLLNMLVNYSSVKMAQVASALTGIRPEIPNMLFSGGINLEASWIAMLTVFFIRSKFFLLVVVGSLIVSSAYLSRTGMLLTVIVLLLYFIETNRHKYSRKALFLVLPLLIVLFISVALFIAIQLDLPVVKRFLEIGNEPGSQGRLDILFYVFDGIYSSFFLGYGAGNAMDYLVGLGLHSNNDNVHNYFLQILLDFGLPGFLAYLTFTYLYLNNKSIPVEFKFFYILYLAGSLVQFRGAEPLFWFLIFSGFLASKEYVAKSSVVAKCAGSYP